MESSVLTSVVLPLSLAIIMMGMGLSLVVADFKRIVKYPKAIVIGLTNQLILLPIIGFLMAKLFHLSPTMAVGLMIIAACPGGPTSNLITQVCRGDIALSVTLTAITSFITVFTIPIILSYALEHFTSQTGTPIELPILDTILQIMVITVIPISIGMIIRRFKPGFSDRMERPMRIASTVIFLIILAAVIYANKELVIPSMKSSGLAALLLNICTMALGYFTARLLKLKLEQAISITIESGIQNGTLAIVIATNIIVNSEMSIPPIAYSLLMFGTGGLLMWILGSRKRTPKASDA